ncbi:MAG: FAD-binding oxidoreductase [Muribaculaceae bacterium]|nr:FAD-binding oxidoreductase [Muribaculaceae bacterium]
MKKYQLTLRVTAIRRLRGDLLYVELRQPDGSAMPPMQPGQFVEVAVDRADVLLRRPFSIFNADETRLELLIKSLGRASEALFSYQVGDTLNVLAPLGRGFLQASPGERVLLVGGGVGVAPLYYQARKLREAGATPVIIYGERTAPDAALCERLAEVAELHLCTDDGSEGFHGLVTEHTAFAADYALMQVCGPMPMMKAVHRLAQGRGDMRVQFSLENKMACGLGACLCCVEKTTTGNRCVCTDGPVFNIDELPW